MNRVPDPVALAKELESIDFTIVTKEEVEERAAYGVIKMAVPDKLITMHLPIGRPPHFEVKSFLGEGIFLDTEDMQAAINAYNQAGSDAVTKEDIENHVAYGVVKLCGADKMFLTQMTINKPPHYVVRDYSGERVFIDTEDMQAAINAYNQA